MPSRRTHLRVQGVGGEWHDFVAFQKRLYHRATRMGRYTRVTWLRLCRTEAGVRVDFAYGHTLPDTTLWSCPAPRAGRVVHRIIAGPAVAQVVAGHPAVYAVTAEALQEHGVHDMRMGDVLRCTAEGVLLYPVLSQQLRRDFACSDAARGALVRFLHENVARKNCQVEVAHFCV